MTRGTNTYVVATLMALTLLITATPSFAQGVCKHNELTSQQPTPVSEYLEQMKTDKDTSCVSFDLTAYQGLESDVDTALAANGCTDWSQVPNLVKVTKKEDVCTTPTGTAKTGPLSAAELTEHKALTKRLRMKDDAERFIDLRDRVKVFGLRDKFGKKVTDQIAQKLPMLTDDDAKIIVETIEPVPPAFVSAAEEDLARIQPEFNSLHNSLQKVGSEAGCTNELDQRRIDTAKAPVAVAEQAVVDAAGNKRALRNLKRVKANLEAVKAKQEKAWVCKKTVLDDIDRWVDLTSRLDRSHLDLKIQTELEQTLKAAKEDYRPNEKVVLTSSVLDVLQPVVKEVVRVVPDSGRYTGLGTTWIERPDGLPSWFPVLNLTPYVSFGAGGDTYRLYGKDHNRYARTFEVGAELYYDGGWFLHKNYLAFMWGFGVFGGYKQTEFRDENLRLEDSVTKEGFTLGAVGRAGINIAEWVSVYGLVRGRAMPTGIEGGGGIELTSWLRFKAEVSYGVDLYQANTGVPGSPGANNNAVRFLVGIGTLF